MFELFHLIIRDNDDDDDWRRTVRVGVEIGNMMMMMMIYANHLCPKKSQ